MILNLIARLSGVVALSIGIVSMPLDAQAQTLSSQGDGAGTAGNHDCTEVSVDYMNDPTLTDAEKLALMDQALQRSLSKYDACQTSKSNADGGGGGGVSGSGGGSGGGGEVGNNGNGTGDGSSGGGNSTASSDISGTEQPATPESDQGQGSSTGTSSWTNPNNDPVEQTSESQQPAGQKSGTKPLNNGKLPEDIPPADNDSILEAQIRQAAINEKDLEVQKKLWNEYRKYKDLPEVE